MRNPKEAKPLEYYLELNYPITIYRAEEGGFVAENEDLHGCLTQGETIEEAIENIEEARQLWIQAAYEDGVEIPIPRTDEEYSGRFLVRIPKSLHRRLAEQARYEGVSLNQHAQSILSAGMSTQNIIEEISAKLEKISSQITEQGAPLVAYPTSYYNFIWEMEGVVQETEVTALREIKNKEQVIAA